MNIIGGGGIEATKFLCMCNYSLAGFKKTPTKIEQRTGMDEPLVIELAIKEAIKMEIKYTLAHSNQ